VHFVHWERNQYDAGCICSIVLPTQGRIEVPERQIKNAEPAKEPAANLVIGFVGPNVRQQPS
jgi:hypothetical protein